MSKLSQQLGKAGEERARWFFNEIGAKCVEKISTPMVYSKGKWVFSKSSSIDFTAAFPVGYRSYIPVRIEVKLCDSDRLYASRIKDHQKKWLEDWMNCGFISFVLWVHINEVFLIYYHKERFIKGASISVNKAREIMKNSRWKV